MIVASISKLRSRCGVSKHPAAVIGAGFPSRGDAGSVRALTMRTNADYDAMAVNRAMSSGSRAGALAGALLVAMSLLAACGGSSADLTDATPGLDECSAGTDDCDQNALCTDTPDGFTCACQPGYVGDGRSCAVDACAAGDRSCGAHGSCVNRPEGPACACDPGYADDGQTCRAAFGSFALAYDLGCAVRADGTLWCWGAKSAAQHDKPFTSETVATPARVGEASNWRQVSVGDQGAACAIRTDGTLWCWGNNACGALGLGETARCQDATIPFLSFTQIGTGRSWRQVDVSFDHSCAIAEDASLWCWGGANAGGALGLGHGEPALAPARVGTATDWSTVRVSEYRGIAGAGYTCGIRRGEVWCWGYNEFGVIGLPASTDRALAPQRVSGVTGGVEVRVARTHACALTGSGDLWCWGTNAHGQLGLGHGEVRDAFPPTKVATRVASVGVAYGTTCIVDEHSTLRCAGLNGSGALGPSPIAPSFVALVEEDGWTRVDGARSVLTNFCASKSDHVLRCWGNNVYGVTAVGIGAHPGSLRTWRSDARWQKVVVGSNSACGIRDDQSLWCWGNNSRGQLGIGLAGNYSGIVRDAPQPVLASARWRDVAMHAYAGERVCGIQVDGTLWCWGNVPGIGDQIVPRSFGIAPSGRSYASVAVGDTGHACAIDEAGALYCWGANDSGQLGTNDSWDHSEPTAVAASGGAAWTSVTVSGRVTCGVRSGQLFCWGSSCTLAGNCSQPNVLVPVRWGAGSDWRVVLDAWGLRGERRYAWAQDISTPVDTFSWRHFTAQSWTGRQCGITVNDDLACWGQRNDDGLGSADSPFLVDGAKAIRAVAVGMDFGFAVQMDGNVLVWGNNRGGIGDGWSHIEQPTPIAAP
jgi:alpha-tubulin suppressor-like RCC1 family protein